MYERFQIFDLTFDLCILGSTCCSSSVPPSPCPTELPALSTAPPQAPRITDVRLPKALTPILYNVELKPNIYNGMPETFTFDGYVNILMFTEEVTSNITLHMKSLIIINSTLGVIRIDGGADPIITTYDYDIAREFVIFHLDRELIAGKAYSIHMNFTGPLMDDLVGLYYSSYDRNGQTT